MSTDPRYLSGGLMVVKSRDERRKPKSPDLENPPRLFVVFYDAKWDQLKKEEISFEAAQALAPEKFELAMKELEVARRIDGPPHH